jgi:transposase
VPDELWELFQRVVPEAPTRPQGGGRRRHGDREVLAAIVFVATSACTWQQVPSASFGPWGVTAHRLPLFKARMFKESIAHLVQSNSPREPSSSRTPGDSGERSLRQSREV